MLFGRQRPAARRAGGWVLKQRAVSDFLRLNRWLYELLRCYQSVPATCSLATVPTLSQSDIDHVLAHCRSKVGVEEHRVHRNRIKFGVLSGSLDFFATFSMNDEPRQVLLRCSDVAREQLENSGASARISDRMKWSGPDWKWTDVGLDGGVSLQTLIPLIDESYDFAVVRLKDSQKRILSLLARKLPPRQILAEMIAGYDLQDRKTDIEQLLLPALRLKTSPIDEAQLPLGSSKIGGHPDLPTSVRWPNFRGARPLSFLAQIKLDEVLLDQRLADLPSGGILYVFSVYGWQAEDTADPDTPGGEPQQDWTQILFHDDSTAPLHRCNTPEGASEYPAARVTFHPTLCLPISVDEPSVVALGLDQSQARRFDEMNSAFTYAANYEDGPHDRHLLLGYADWVQRVIDPVKRQDLRLLIQVASDPNTGMCWGDGGYIYAFISKPDLQQRRFSNITTEYQCG
jgi:predicted DNA-binding protein (MmcQ/YjbR family)